MMEEANLTVLPVVEYLEVPLDALGQGLPDDADGLLRREGPVEEVARGGPLHHLRPGEPRQSAEAVRAVDDVARVPLRVRHHETPICPTKTMLSLQGMRLACNALERIQMQSTPDQAKLANSFGGFKDNFGLSTHFTL